VRTNADTLWKSLVGTFQFEVFAFDLLQAPACVGRQPGTIAGVALDLPDHKPEHVPSGHSGGI